MNTVADKFFSTAKLPQKLSLSFRRAIPTTTDCRPTIAEWTGAKPTVMNLSFGSFGLASVSDQ
jgi:hypothetical protein